MSIELASAVTILPEKKEREILRENSFLADAFPLSSLLRRKLMYTCLARFKLLQVFVSRNVFTSLQEQRIVAPEKKIYDDHSKLNIEEEKTTRHA
jgi:hypothetical protein